MEFLTPEESSQVDAALLSSKEKFSTRLAIYALRCLKQIAEQENITIENIDSEQIRAWIKNDESIKNQLELDANFENFFTQLVVSSLKPLKQAALEADVQIQNLSVKQVITWFEHQAKTQLK